MRIRVVIRSGTNRNLAKEYLAKYITMQHAASRCSLSVDRRKHPISEERGGCGVEQFP